MPQHVRDLTNQIFGRLTVLSRVPAKRGTTIFWLCKCVCGKEKAINGGNLKTGQSRSCGCLLKDLGISQTKHGLSRSRVYMAWINMHARCYGTDPIRKLYYQDKGIIVCERWHIFENFFIDMGHPPFGHSLDRIDGDKNYEPGNCRWATKSEQARNKKFPTRAKGELRKLLKGIV